MADSSFDIVSEINLQEMDNAIMQAQKEIGTRYDFKGTAASVEFNRKEKELTLTADAEPQLEAVRKVIIERMIKRGVAPKCLDPQKLEQATMSLDSLRAAMGRPDSAAPLYDYLEHPSTYKPATFAALFRKAAGD